MIGWWIADMSLWGGAAMLALLAAAQVVARREGPAVAADGRA